MRVTKYTEYLVESKEFEQESKYRDYLFSNINEAGLSRLVDKVKIEKKDFLIISGYRGEYTNNVNKRNHINIMNYLNSLKLGAYNLVGHWVYTDDENGTGESVKEQSLLVVRPDTMSVEDFMLLIDDLLYDKHNNLVKVLDPETGDMKAYIQEAILYSIDGEIYLKYSNERPTEKIGDTMTLNKAGEIYSIMQSKPEVPFVFEGISKPYGWISAHIFKKDGVFWNI